MAPVKLQRDSSHIHVLLLSTTVGNIISLAHVLRGLINQHYVRAVHLEQES